MATGSTVKEEARHIVDSLPDEVTWEELVYRLYVRQSIESGLKDAREGKFVSVEEIQREFELQE